MCQVCQVCHVSCHVCQVSCQVCQVSCQMCQGVRCHIRCVRCNASYDHISHYSRTVPPPLSHLRERLTLLLWKVPVDSKCYSWEPTGQRSHLITYHWPSLRIIPKLKNHKNHHHHHHHHRPHHHQYHQMTEIVILTLSTTRSTAAVLRSKSIQNRWSNFNWLEFLFPKYLFVIKTETGHAEHRTVTLRASRSNWLQKWSKSACSLCSSVLLLADTFSSKLKVH